MSGTLPPVYALLTALTALLVTTVLVPVFRLILEPGVVLPRGTTLRPPAASGSLSVLVAAAVLLPMGGDGVLLPFTDTPIAFGLLSALLLFFAGSTRLYRSLPFVGRLVIQTAMAVLVALGGVHAQAGTLTTHVMTVAVLLVSMNAFEALGRARGLSTAAGTVAAGFLACIAPAFSEHGLADLNLGLCGALLAVMAFQVVPRNRIRVELGSGGRLAVGFLIGMSYVRLAPQAVPDARIWMVLPMALPLVALVIAMLAPVVRRVLPTSFGGRARRAPWHRLSAWLGFQSAHVLVLGFLVNLTVALATLRALGMF